jgi:hypothetical protein
VSPHTDDPVSRFADDLTRIGIVPGRGYARTVAERIFASPLTLLDCLVDAGILTAGRQIGPGKWWYWRDELTPPHVHQWEMAVLDLDTDDGYRVIRWACKCGDAHRERVYPPDD